MAKSIKGHGTVARYNRGCRCDECKAAKSVAMSAYYQENRSARLAAAMKRYAIMTLDPEWRSAENRRIAQWAREHPDLRRQEATSYREANRDKCRAKSNAYTKSPRGAIKNRASQSKRRALTREGSDAATTYGVILLADPCCYCGGMAGTIDHITPVIEGGSGEWWNLTAACLSCNSRKNRRSLLGLLMLMDRREVA